MVKIYLAEIGDANAETIDTYFYDLPTTSLRRNRYIFPSSTQAGPGVTSTDLRVVNVPELFKITGFGPGTGAYLYPGMYKHISLMTIIIA